MRLRLASPGDETAAAAGNHVKNSAKSDPGGTNHCRCAASQRAPRALTLSFYANGTVRYVIMFRSVLCSAVPSSSALYFSD